MSAAKGQRLLVSIIIGALLGAACGTFFPAFAVRLHFLGELFLNALKMMVLPLIVTSLIVGITGLGDPRKLGSLGLLTFIYYMTTTGIAVAIGIAVVYVAQPGAGFGAVLGETAAREVNTGNVSFMDTILRLIHPNLVEAAANFDVLPLITASILFGAALVAVGKRARPLVDLIHMANEAVMRVVHWIIFFTPLGVFGLIAHRLGAAGGGEAVWGLLVQLSRYCLTVVAGLAVHGLVVLPAVLYVFTRRNPFVFFSKMAKAIVTAFGTSSSSATLPVTMECVKEEAKVNREVSDVVLPIGATVNMDGTALYEAVAVIFISQAYGVTLEGGQYLVIFLTATLAAIGAAGIPEAGLVTMVLVLQAVGLPVEGIGLILAVDWLLDRCRTTINIWGDGIGAAVLEKFHRE